MGAQSLPFGVHVQNVPHAMREPVHARCPRTTTRCLSRAFLYVQSIVFVLAKARAKKRVHEIASYAVFFCWNAFLCSHLQVSAGPCWLSQPLFSSFPPVRRHAGVAGWVYVSPRTQLVFCF